MHWLSADLSFNDNICLLGVKGEKVVATRNRKGKILPLDLSFERELMVLNGLRCYMDFVQSHAIHGILLINKTSTTAGFYVLPGSFLSAFK